MGVKVLRKIQLGRESVAGTPVAATTVWRGLGVLDDQREVVFPDEDIGIISGDDRSYIPKYAAGISLASVPATYQQILHPLEAGIKTDTPAADGGGTDFIYEYGNPTMALNTLKTYTIEGGDNDDAEEMEYAFCTQLSLEGMAGEALMMASEWLGRQVTSSGVSFTGAVAVPTVEEILFSKGKLYIDAVSGSYGGTQITNTLLAMSLNITTGWQPKWTADGSLYFSFHYMSKPQISGSLTFEHNAGAVTQKELWRANTPRLMRLKFEGSAFVTPGTTYTYHTLLIDLPLTYSKFNPLGEQNGNDVVQADFVSKYNATVGNAGIITVVNELAAVQ